MAKIAYLDEEDRKLLTETKQKLDEATKLMGELMETIEVLSDPDMMQNIRQGLADIKAGRVKELRTLLLSLDFHSQARRQSYNYSALFECIPLSRQKIAIVGTIDPVDCLKIVLAIPAAIVHTMERASDALSL